MKTKSGIMIAFLCAAGGAALHQGLALREAKAVFEATAARHGGLETDLRRIGQQLRQTEKLNEKLRQTIELLRTTAHEGAPASEAAVAGIDPVEEALLSDPNLQRLKLAAQRAELAARYHSLFTRLRLSAKQIETCKDIMMKRDERAMDLSAVKQARRLDGNDPIAARLEQETEAEFKSALTDLLGDSGYSQFEDYERLATAHQSVDRFNGFVSLAGVPLSIRQIEQLTSIFAEVDYMQSNPGDWSNALEPASAVLSHRQFVALKDMLAIDQLRWKRTLALQRALQTK